MVIMKKLASGIKPHFFDISQKNTLLEQYSKTITRSMAKHKLKPKPKPKPSYNPSSSHSLARWLLVLPMWPIVALCYRWNVLSITTEIIKF